MKNIKNLPATRKGAASFYVVIFAALVFTVIVLSFVRLMISESSQNIANDLSQSAYDSALAGVEDAKAAYAICLESNFTATGCDHLFDNECNAMSAVLGFSPVSENSNQSYSCVILARNLYDYRVNLSAATPVVVVPISDSQHVKVSWFSSANNEDSNQNQFKHLDSTAFLKSDSQIIPPVLSVGFIESGSSDIRTIILRPSDANDNTNSYTSATEAYNKANNSSDVNKKVLVRCSTGNDPACNTGIINTSSIVEYLVISLPYHETNTVSVKVEKFQNNNESTAIPFQEQISVDSTGRANDYYRRVESRLQLSDLDFPYPEYVLSVSGRGSNSSLIKDYWVTNNCWVSSGGQVSNGGYCGGRNSGTL